MATPVSLMDDQMVDMAFITQLTGLTDKWFYKLIKDGGFPAPIKMGRSSRWLKSEVAAWLQARIAQSRPEFLNPNPTPKADAISGLPAALGGL